ncbi:MAG: hypothetical protein R3C09_18135 [Pirellulaceae bacterium]
MARIGCCGSHFGNDLFLVSSAPCRTLRLMSSLPNSAPQRAATADVQTGLLPSTESVRQALHQHLKKTASFIKFMDALVLLSGWIATMLLIWLAACAIDHWLWPLSTAGRWAFWATGVAACGWWLLWQCLPLLLGRINPLYAAKRIEHLVPEFKNGLIAWLELERMPEQRVPRGVMSALAHRAARYIGGQDPSATVDTSPLIKMIGYVLVLTTSLAVYTMLSPKSVFATGQRILMPWSSLAAPTRVQILEVSPGPVELTQGKPLQVAVAVKGLRHDEPVNVRFSTLDGQLQNQRRQLSASIEGFRYQGDVATSGTGVEQPLDYWIEAGDAQLGPFRVTISPLPAVVLQSIELQYPPYTRLPKRSINDDQVEAVEGTRATITARANQTLQRGRLEINPTLDATGELVRADRFLDMTSNQRQLQATVPLLLDSERNNPTRIEYRIRGTNHRGDSNARPITHKISVLADVPPEVDLLGPDSRVLRVRPKAHVNLEVRASDPDFGLTKLTLNASRDGVDAPPIVLFENAEGALGRQVKTYRIDLAKWKAAVGQRFELRAHAMDNRHDPESGQPAAGATESKLLTLLVVADDEPADAASQPPPAENEPQSDSHNGDNTDSDPQSSPEQSTQKDDGQKDGQKAASEKVSGQKGDGSNDSAQNDSSSQNNRQENGGQEDPQGGDAGQQDSGQQDGSQQNGTQQGGTQQGGTQQGGTQQGGTQQGSEQQSDRQQGGSQQGSGQQSGSQQGGSQQGGSQQGSGQPSNNAASGQQSSESTTRSKPSSDGEAIERVSEYLESQPGGKPSENAPPSPQGSESEGSPAHSSESQGSKPEGSPAQGSESQGSKPEGSPAQGSESQGRSQKVHQRKAPNRRGRSQKVHQRRAPNRRGRSQKVHQHRAPNRRGRSQKVHQRRAPNRRGRSQKVHQRRAPSPRGRSQKVHQPQGSESQGSKPEGSPAQGSESQGSKPEGSPAQGSESQGSKPEGSPAQGSESQGSEPEGSPHAGLRIAGVEARRFTGRKAPNRRGRSQKVHQRRAPNRRGRSQKVHQHRAPSPRGRSQKVHQRRAPNRRGRSQKVHQHRAPNRRGRSQKVHQRKAPNRRGRSRKVHQRRAPSPRGRSLRVRVQLQTRINPLARERGRREAREGQPGRVRRPIESSRRRRQTWCSTISIDKRTNLILSCCGSSIGRPTT